MAGTTERFGVRRQPRLPHR